MLLNCLFLWGVHGFETSSPLLCSCFHSAHSHLSSVTVVFSFRLYSVTKNESFSPRKVRTEETWSLISVLHGRRHITGLFMGSLEPIRSKIRKENEHVRKASPSRWRSVDSQYSILQGLFYLIHGGMDESFILCKDMGGRQFLYCMTYTAGVEGGTGLTLKWRFSLVISSFSSCSLLTIQEKLMAVVMKFTLAVLLVWTQKAGLCSYLCRKLQLLYR